MFMQGSILSFSDSYSVEPNATVSHEIQIEEVSSSVNSIKHCKIDMDVLWSLLPVPKEDKIVSLTQRLTNAMLQCCKPWRTSTVKVLFAPIRSLWFSSIFFSDTVSLTNILSGTLLNCAIFMLQSWGEHVHKVQTEYDSFLKRNFDTVTESKEDEAKIENRVEMEKESLMQSLASSIEFGVELCDFARDLAEREQINDIFSLSTERLGETRIEYSKSVLKSNLGHENDPRLFCRALAYLVLAYTQGVGILAVEKALYMMGKVKFTFETDELINRAILAAIGSQNSRLQVRG